MQFKLQFLPVLVLLICVNLACPAKILFFFGLSTYSHRIVVWPLAEALAAKGHDVTFVQPFPPRTPNPKIKEFCPKSFLEFGNQFEHMNFLNVRLAEGHSAVLNLVKNLPNSGYKMCDLFLSSPETQEWVKGSKFDLVVIDGLFNDCAFGLAHLFKAKTILFGTSHPFVWWPDSFGMNPETSWIPEFHLAYQLPLNFYQRLVTTLVHLRIHHKKQTDYYPQLGKLFQERFGLGEAPDIAELERETSLIFSNTHFSEELGRSLPPLIVPVGGIHCEDKTQTLSKELKDFMDGSGDAGFIYVSFGSAAKISEAPADFQDIFYQAIAKSKLRFVWKFEGERTDKIPKNVFTAKWMPQQAVLAHPKVKAFLTHGGLLGIQEAVWHGVPLIAMPLFAEQDYNSQRVERTKRGVMLDPNTLTQAKLEEAIRKVTTDPLYRRNMQELSIMFKDRPQKPLDTAVWWTEYVLRHDSTANLKPLSIHQTWYERRLLDVWGFIFCLFTLVLIIVFYVIKKILGCVFGTSRGSRKQKTQ